MLVVSQPPPLALPVFVLSDWWERPVPLSAYGGLEDTLARRRRKQGGGAPPDTAASEVARPEARNDRRNTRKIFSLPYES